MLQKMGKTRVLKIGRQERNRGAFPRLPFQNPSPQGKGEKVEKMFNVGDKVELTDAMKKAAKKPEKYTSGTITEIGYWGVVSVKFENIGRPIMMRVDELKIL